MYLLSSRLIDSIPMYWDAGVGVITEETEHPPPPQYVKTCVKKFQIFLL